MIIKSNMPMLFPVKEKTFLVTHSFNIAVTDSHDEWYTVDI